MSRRTALILFSLGVARPLRLPAPRENTLIFRRNFLLQATALAGGGTLSLGAAGLVGTQMRRLLEPARAGPEYYDPLAESLRSATGDAARLERKQLIADWRTQRQEGRLGRAPTEAAFASVLRVRRALGEADALARAEADDWQAGVDALVAPTLVAELERACTLLATSPVLSDEARAAIGWAWGCTDRAYLEDQ